MIMQFNERTRSVTNIKVKDSLYTPAPKPFEDLKNRIRIAIAKPKPYVIPNGQSITLADVEHIEKFQKLKLIQQAVVDETFVDRLLAHELIDQIECGTVHLRLFPEYLLLKQHLQEAFAFDLWPYTYSSGTRIISEIR